jgi:transcriptional regulator with XRE-family HTH domain
MANSFRKWRKAQGLTQIEAAALFKMSQPSIAKWENGHVPPEQCLLVNKVTGIPLHELRPDIYPKPKTDPHIPEVA